MKLEDAEQIVDFLDSEGVEATLYEDYSGRAMFGTTTAGVVTSNAGDVAYAMGALSLKLTPRTDSMGLDIISY